jgi:hypothetical protein
MHRIQEGEMKLIRITVELAFHDIYEATADWVADHLVEISLDNMEAEVVRTDRLEKQIDFPDPSAEDDPGYVSYETWQERAHKELSNWKENNEAADG